MKEFWTLTRVCFSAIGGWLGYFLGGCDNLMIISMEQYLAVQAEINRRTEQYQRCNGQKTIYPFTGKLVCESCGKHYQRKKTATGYVWICSTFNREGKSACPSRQIPEKVLEQLSADALKTVEFDVAQFEKQIEYIDICQDYFGAKVWHSNSKYRRVIYQCNSKFKNEHSCSTPHLYEPEIQQKFLLILYSIEKCTLFRECIFYIVSIVIQICQYTTILIQSYSENNAVLR